MGIYSGDKKIDKIYLGDQLIMEAGGGDVHSLLQKAIDDKKGDDLYFFYADAKNIIANDTTGAFDAMVVSRLPGSNVVLKSSSRAEYYGTVDNRDFGKFTDGSQAGKEISNITLPAQVGITQGTAFNGDFLWHKFKANGSFLYIASKAIRHSIAWNSINSAGCVTGKEIHLTSGSYRVRLLSDDEWDYYMQGLANGTYANLTDDMLDFRSSGSGYKSWTSTDIIEPGSSSTLYTLCYGSGGESYDAEDPTYVLNTTGWRPALTITP